MSNSVKTSTLKSLRKAHGLTQVDLAMKSGVGLNFVRELEQGKATVRMDKVAQVIKSQTTLTGVQPKLSLNLDKHKDSQKLTIVGLWGGYIFKPQTDRFAMLPITD